MSLKTFSIKANGVANDQYQCLSGIFGTSMQWRKDYILELGLGEFLKYILFSISGNSGQILQKIQKGCLTGNKIIK